MSKGLVKGVLSGDTIIISGALSKDYSLPEEINLTLTGVFAPKIGNASKLEEEPYSFESREFLRKLIIGKVVHYKIDYTHNDRKFGHIKFENKLINAEILKSGYARIGYLPKTQENLYKSELWTSLKAAEKEAMDNKRGIYEVKEEKEEKDKHIRKLGNLSDLEEAKKKIQEHIESGDNIDAIVEYVFNTSMVSIYIPSLSCFSKINLRFVQIPSPTKDPELFKIGKAKSERLCLSKDIKLKIFDIDSAGTLTGDIFLQIDKTEQNLALYLLKNGFCKSFTGGNKNPKVFNLLDINLARAAENEAKAKRAGLWKNENIPDIKKIKKENQDDLSQAKCIMVNSGDSLTVLNNKKEEVRIFLSNLKAPAMARFGSDEQNKPWAFQSKEFVRKKLVGKTLICELDYIHTINLENLSKKELEKNKDTKRVMKFYTVYYPDEKKQNICINVELIENGLANLTNYKIEEGNPSKEFDSMLKAEQEAKNNKVGLHSTKVPALCTYSDLLVSGKIKKKEFVNFLTGLTNMNCVVDFCFSATKLKLRIDEKQVMIPFNLLGVKSFSNDKNNSSLFQKYFKLSHDFAVDILLQRDAICDIIQSDKLGNYFGNLIYYNEKKEKKNFGTALIEKGFAVVNERSYDKGKNKYIEEMKIEEKKAMEGKKGLWADEGLAKLLKGEENIDASNTDGKLEIVNKDIKIRITDEIDLDKFFCNFLPNKTLDKIEQVLSDYDDGIEKAENLVAPIKQGTLCAARFPEDDRYYRAVIKKYNKEQNEYQVEFIDYGNIEWVKLHDLIKLDGKISSLPPQAMVCGLAYLKYSKISMRKAVKKYPNFVDFDNELNAKLCYSYKKGSETKYGLIVFKEGKNDMKNTYHADLLKEGLAKLNRNGELPEYMKDLEPIDEQAEREEIGVWDDNEETDYGQNEDEY